MGGYSLLGPSAPGSSCPAMRDLRQCGMLPGYSESSKEIPDSHELHGKAVRMSKEGSLAMWETSLGSCRGWKVARGLREVHVLISPERGKKVELGIYPPLICMLILTKNCRMLDSSNGMEGFLRGRSVL